MITSIQINILMIISKNQTDFEKKLSNLEQIRYIEDFDNFHRETAYLKPLMEKKVIIVSFLKSALISLM